MIRYIYKCKNFLINILFYSLYYNIYSGCCKKRPTKEQLIQLEIEKHKKLVNDNFFEKTITKTKKCNNKKGFSLYENINEINRMNFKIRRATSSADFDKIITDIESNKVLNEEIKKNFSDDVNKRKQEAKKREDEFKEALNAEIKSKEDIYNLYKIAEYNQLDELKKKLEDNKTLFSKDDLEKLEKSIKSKGSKHEDNFINDYIANKNDLKLEDIDKLKKDVENFKYIDPEKIKNFKNYLDNYKKELENLEEAKKKDENQQKQIQELLNKINTIKNEFEEAKQECNDNNLEKLEKYKDKTIELKTRIDEINITEYKDYLKNIKDNLTKEINEEKIKSAENYIDNCTKIEDLDKVKLENYDEIDKTNLTTKINSKRESLLQTFKNQFAKYLNYCNNYNIKKIRNINILTALINLKALKDIKNDTTNINEYMEDLNELKYHYILRKIDDITIIENFKEENITFNDNILSQPVKNDKTTLDAKIKELKKTIIDLLNKKYFKTNAKNVKKVIDYKEYFKYVYYNNKEKIYYNDKDKFSKIFKEYKDDISSYKKIATVTIDEDNKYVIFSKDELMIRKKIINNNLYFTKTNEYNEINDEKLDFIIACVV